MSGFRKPNIPENTTLIKNTTWLISPFLMKFYSDCYYQLPASRFWPAVVLHPNTTTNPLPLCRNVEYPPLRYRTQMNFGACDNIRVCFIDCFCWHRTILVSLWLVIASLLLLYHARPNAHCAFWNCWFLRRLQHRPQLCSGPHGLMYDSKTQ